MKNGREANMHPLDDDHFQGKERRFYSVRLFSLCVAVSIFVSAATCVIVALALRADSDQKIYHQDIAACQRSNDVRAESNQRIHSHELDRDNLAQLARRLARTRDAEAKTWTSIAHGFGINQQVHPIVTVLRRARDADRAIAASEARVTFRPLQIYDCHNPKIVHHP